MAFTTSLIQFDIVFKDPEQNRKILKKWVKEAVNNNPDLLVLPETWTTGFAASVFKNADRYAEKEDGKSISLIREIAADNNVYIAAGSIIEKDGNNFYNTMYLVDREGSIVGKYRKMHLFSVLDEDRGLNNGEDMPVFKTDFGKLACMTCYDIRFVEMARTYALKGAQAIIVVANFPAPRLNHWRILLQARAIENQLYIIACNRVGQAEGNYFFGHSMVINPRGEIITEAGEEKTVLTASIDFNRVSKVRNEIPMYKDRKPEFYFKTGGI